MEATRKRAVESDPMLSNDNVKKRKTEIKTPVLSNEGNSSASASKPKSKVKKPRARPKVNPLKPKAGSWLHHISATVVDMCIQQAKNNAIDPRNHLDHINWGLWAPTAITGEDLKKLWIYISREYPVTSSLQEVRDQLQPYSTLTTTEILNDELKTKYKDLMPKPPLSPYLLFAQSKSSKIRQKFPGMPQTEVAIRLGRKWNGMGVQRQEKYHRQSAALKEIYHRNLQQFYEDYPDARLYKKDRKKEKPKNTALKKVMSAEEERIKELKSLAPKAPISAYLLFCNKKRNKVHQHHPELNPTDVTVKLGKKWKSIGPDGQAKYKRRYQESVELYKVQMKEFYDQYPEAEELLKNKRKAKASKTNTSHKNSTELSLKPINLKHIPSNKITKNETMASDEEEEQEEEEIKEVIDCKGSNGSESEGDEEEEEEEDEEEEEEDEEEEAPIPRLVATMNASKKQIHDDETSSDSDSDSDSDSSNM